MHGEVPAYNKEKGLTLKLEDWPTNGKPWLLGITPIFGDRNWLSVYFMETSSGTS